MNTVRFAATTTTTTTTTTNTTNTTNTTTTTTTTNTTTASSLLCTDLVVGEGLVSMTNDLDMVHEDHMHLMDMHEYEPHCHKHEPYQ